MSEQSALLEAFHAGQALASIDAVSSDPAERERLEKLIGTREHWVARARAAGVSVPSVRRSGS